jgi:hypothetical protein
LALNTLRICLALNTKLLGDVFNACEKVAFGKLYRHARILFRENKLCACVLCL